MLVAKFNGYLVEIEDARAGVALVHTLDGSTPFWAWAARTDPEAPPGPERVPVAWTYARQDELSDIVQVPAGQPEEIGWVGGGVQRSVRRQSGGHEIYPSAG